MSQKKMYGPCPCGSGKKFKLCCYLKRSKQTGDQGVARFGLRKQRDDGAIVRGSFGPDALRSAALTDLKKRGEVDSKDRIVMLQKGEYREITRATTKINWDFEYGEPLSKKWAGLFESAFFAGKEEDPDWEAIGEMYQKILTNVPDCFSVRYNYATTLMYRDRVDEAEFILKAILEEHPDYLFAAATLLEVYCSQDRVEEAKAHMKAMVLPEETHPDAMVAWLMAASVFYEMVEEDEVAELCFEQAHAIDPDNPMVKERREMDMALKKIVKELRALVRDAKL